MNLDTFNAKLAEVNALYQSRINILVGAQTQVWSIEHESGHLLQALTNVMDGIEKGTMSEERAIEVMRNVGGRLDDYSKILLEATQK